jgi:mRNA interferase HigB
MKSSQFGNFLLTSGWNHGRFDAVRVISRKKLVDFWAKHPDSAGQLQAWFTEAKRAAWATPARIKEQYASASILKEGRVVFNICGNKYRLLCYVLYGQKTVYIKFVGTHKEYDAIEAETYGHESH